MKQWKTTIKEMHKSYDKLLFFSVPKVLSLHAVIKHPGFSADKIIQEIGFLFENSPKAIEMLRRAANVINLVLHMHILL